jgi:hypothetical protein
MWGRASLLGDFYNQAKNKPGCVLASRLSASLPENKILLIEAGKESDGRIKPTMGVALSEHGDLQWDLRSCVAGGF